MNNFRETRVSILPLLPKILNFELHYKSNEGLFEKNKKHVNLKMILQTYSENFIKIEDINYHQPHETVQL